MPIGPFKANATIIHIVSIVNFAFIMLIPFSSVSATIRSSVGFAGSFGIIYIATPVATRHIPMKKANTFSKIVLKAIFLIIITHISVEIPTIMAVINVVNYRNFLRIIDAITTTINDVTHIVIETFILNKLANPKFIESYAPAPTSDLTVNDTPSVIVNIPSRNINNDFILNFICFTIQILLEYYSFPPDVAIPSINFFWKIINTRTIGQIASKEPAIS